MRRRRVLLGGVLGFALGGVACQLVLGLDEPVGTARPPGTTADGGVFDPCRHTRPLEKPPPSTSPSGREFAFWSVMTPISFPLVDDAGAPRGFDLDEACTCSADLHDGAPPCRNLAGKRACDADGGVDNTFVEALLPYQPILDIGAATNRASASGGPGVLIYVSAYNGEADDDEVGVAIVPSEGLFSAIGCNGQPRPGVVVPDASFYSEFLPPTHDGCDHWKVKDGFLASTRTEPVPVSGLGVGYVRNGRLVSRARGVSLPFAGRVLTTADGIFTAEIRKITVADRQTFELVDGIAVGRAPMAELVDVVAHVRVTGASGANEELCLNPLWSVIKTTLCESLDVMTSAVADFHDDVCDGYSITWGFGARPIYIDDAGRSLKPDPPEPGCSVIRSPEALCAGGR